MEYPVAIRRPAVFAESARKTDGASYLKYDDETQPERQEMPVESCEVAVVVTELGIPVKPRTFWAFLRKKLHFLRTTENKKNATLFGLPSKSWSGRKSAVW